MKKSFFNIYFSFTIFFLLLGLSLSNAQSTLDCNSCHSDKVDLWKTSAHGNTQSDVASELGSEWAGLPPDSVIFGQDAEDCLACHSPTSITANGGMTEVQTLGHFFSTTNGNFSASTVPLDTLNWPNIACVTCHNVPADHPTSLPGLAIFNSFGNNYSTVSSASNLCGQCHGTLRYADTDHRRFDAWKSSKHGHGGQGDVASELAEERVGQTPDEVINGDDSENCIACHTPTAVLMNGGISESEALALLFTTQDSVFTESTVPQDSSQWTEVACIACHNPHKPGDISYFNSTTRKYEVMSSSEELCGQCHGNLRFPDTDHLSYNIEQGTGGKGVTDKVTMPNVTCVDCHMYSADIDGSNSTMFGGHSWAIFVQEDGGNVISSCTNCHSTMTAEIAKDSINSWLDQFASLDSVANEKIILAQNKLVGSTDSTQLAKLKEAEFNLTYAESDESGGAHNHFYTQALLNNAINNSNQIITGIENDGKPITNEFRLYQNYPNPFNPTTNIKYTVSSVKTLHSKSQQENLVQIKVYNVLGKEVATLVNKKQNPGNYEITFNGMNLPSGIYFYHLKAGTFTKTRKMILLK